MGNGGSSHRRRRKGQANVDVDSESDDAESNCDCCRRQCQDCLASDQNSIENNNKSWASSFKSLIHPLPQF